MSLPSQAVRTALTVPRDALVIPQNRSYVRRVTGAGTVEELDVTPGAGVADVIEVQGPLAAGDRLVIRGGERLAAGQTVRVIDATHRAVTNIHPGCSAGSAAPARPIPPRSFAFHRRALARQAVR